MVRGRHKGAHDPLVPVAAHRWLVIRDGYSRVVEYSEIEPLTDLRVVLSEEQERRRRAGWQDCDMPPRCAFFFCDRDGERLCIGIECYLPGTRPIR